MPRKTKSPGSKPNKPQVVQGRYWLDSEAPWGGFINVSISDEEKEAYFAWSVENDPYIPSMLSDLLGEGMKVGLAYDQENECAIVTFTGGLVEGANLRCCVTSRAGTTTAALSLALWKHIILCGGEYGDLLATGRKRSWG